MENTSDSTGSDASRGKKVLFRTVAKTCLGVFCGVAVAEALKGGASFFSQGKTQLNHPLFKPLSAISGGTLLGLWGYQNALKESRENRGKLDKTRE